MLRSMSTVRRSCIGCYALLAGSALGRFSTSSSSGNLALRHFVGVNSILCEASIEQLSSTALSARRTSSLLSFHRHLHQGKYYSGAFVTRQAPAVISSSTSFSSTSFSTFRSMSTITNNLVSIEEAIQAHTQQRIPPNRVIFIDGSWHMPTGVSPRNGRSEFLAGPRIPSSRYFDIDDICAPKGTPLNPKSLPHMKPSPQLFAVAMDRMGITPEDTLYVYGTEGCGFVHRAYWTLRSCGHDPEKVKLVQGSLGEWKECGGELEYGELKESEKGEGHGADYCARLIRMSDLDWENMTPKYTCCEGKKDHAKVVDMEEMLDIVGKSDRNGGGDAGPLIVDARSAGRYIGTEPEPRPGLRGGHMPGALNVPFVSLLNSNDFTKFRPMEEVKEIFIKAGVEPLMSVDADNAKDATRKVICSCGSGVTAAALAVALEECGLRERDDILIYDGSWIEWGGDDNTPIVKDE